ncbi:hypothetical protein ABZT43_15895 [Streptomyces sp. NPDC005349]|uniref:hypothetical protein n=1 Tax=Streptomyces sp. NPDC005349 TaxID=3157037 RepID=UPI00339E3FE9
MDHSTPKSKSWQWPSSSSPSSSSGSSACCPASTRCWPSAPTVPKAPWSAPRRSGRRPPPSTPAPRPCFAEARRDAARVTQAAREEGAALIAAAREDGLREREALLADGQALIEAERAAAEAELHLTVPELAAELASRIIGEHVPAAAPTQA